MSTIRPYVLSIAGFDPSAGAGVLADVKTFEANKVYGLACISSNTIQHESKFSAVSWTKKEELFSQIKILFEQYKIDFIKIGIVENFSILNQIIDLLLNLNPKCKIIWDPIFSASAGFVFHETKNMELINEIAKKIYIITPNFVEAKTLNPENDAMKNAEMLSEYCQVFLKGGHNPIEPGKDFLFVNGKQKFSFQSKGTVYAKHGSGCIFSSALAANLARGFSMQRAGLRAKQYTAHVMKSNKSLLAYHKI